VLVGEAGWQALPAAVRARFDASAHAGPCVYRGVMQVHASRFGRVIARALRLFGTPIVPWTSEAVGVDVLTWPARTGGLVWDRTYTFEGRAPITITSRKLVARDGTLMEIARAGLGMRLSVSQDGGALVFQSRGYFWRVAGLALPIPGWLTPGRAVIVHRDLGGGAFAFQLRFVHALAGETFFQEGRFRDPSGRMIEASEAAPADLRAEPIGRAA
jgi:hypothetical protein